MEPSRSPISAKIVPARFSLPLFLLSRNHIKQTKFKELRNYIKKKYILYNKSVDEGFENATLQQLRHIAGKDGSLTILKKHASSVMKEGSRETTKKPWQLPPNLYDMSKTPYEGKRGMGGAHWPKLSTHQSKAHSFIRQAHTDFYNLQENQKLSIPCNRTKGFFLTNARDRHATARCMLNCFATCNRNPSDPGPSTYTPASSNKIFKKSADFPSPHLFYHSSSVPQKKNIIHNPHTSFSAAPGRYETRYPKSCPCSSRFVYHAQIELLVDKEKRKKFRNLPYEKIKARNYTSPDWMHVKGRGFRYLFKGTEPPQRKFLSEQNSKAQKSIKLYTDSKYIAMINNPSRTPLSFRPTHISSLQPLIRFNCIPKIKTRKNLRINKKTAFNSCQDRFQEPFHLPALTLNQREKLKQALPLDRQLRDYPVMCKQLSDINSKLNEIPKHMLPNYLPTLRKKNFKFQPLPLAKVLVTESETNVKVVNKDSFFLRSLDTKNFFKTSIRTTSNSNSDLHARL